MNCLLDTCAFIDMIFAPEKLSRIARMVIEGDNALFISIASFDDGKRVIYDVKDDLELPGYRALAEIPGLFNQVRLDESRTCVYWNEDIDLPSDAIYEYGRETGV